MRLVSATAIAALACAGLLATAAVADAKPSHGSSAKAAKTKLAAKPLGSRKSKPEKVATEKGAVPQIPLAEGTRPQTSEADIALVKSAIESLRKGGASKAAEVAEQISDPVARKLVDWLILRSENSHAGSARYLAFIAANPDWPSVGMFRRRAEAMLWAEGGKTTQAAALFSSSPPETGVGHLLLARVLAAKGDNEAASTVVRDTWRYDALPEEAEKQVLERYSALLSPADHKARMETRLFARDNEAALRAARRLDEAQLAIARLRVAINHKNAALSKGDPKKADGLKKLLESVPADARQDPGYLFAQAYALRKADKTSDATNLLLSAPHDLEEIHDGEDWWVERRIMARKLLDLGDARSAYRLVAEAAEPRKENSRVERHFMAGWIALRFLNEPTVAATHFRRIPEVSSHTTSLARANYWLGRVAEASNQQYEARASYAAAAAASASYYGQLARAKLGLPALALAPPPATPEPRNEAQRLELVRALEILYALNERPLAIALMSGAGESVSDIGTLSALGELAEQRQDARGMLHLGKAALARGLPLDRYAFPTVGVPRYSPIAPGLDEATLFAIIRQESMFNPADSSPAQAMGLMQVTPVAGRDTCKRFTCKFDVKRLKNDSAYNLQIGAAELAGVLQDYRGNYLLAFAAYNAGRGRVSEWIARFGDPRDPKVDPVDWVERIPFMETRNYVQRVMENMQVYRSRFASDARLTIEADLRRDAAAR
ncbi:MAG: lytic transglycosylase domain-containing protein [Xanthobacteraceae bacterium]